MRIIFYNTKSYDKIYFDKYFNINGFETVYIEEKLNASTVKLADGFDAVCIFVNDTADSQIINALYRYKVKLLLLRCTGYNNVDVKAAYKKIHILRVPGYSPTSIAEHTLALLMCVNRKIHRAYNRTRDFNFNISGLISSDLAGKTAGIIGTGKIGKIFVNILNGMGMRVLAFDKFPDSSLAAEYVSLDDLFKKSDVISLHCPLTVETKHIINAESISKMKEGVIIINTSRGMLIDTGAVINALDEKKIGGLGFDVYEEEENYFYEDRSEEIVDDKELVCLLSYPNVLLTSHQAFLTHEALETIAAVTTENITAYLKGGFMQNEVCYQCEQKGTCKKKNNRMNCFEIRN